MMVRLIIALQVLGIAVLLFCAVGSVLLSDWISTALAMIAAVTLMLL